MDNNKQRQAARAFVERWTGKGDEKGEAQKFWLELLQKVLGVDDPYSVISFEGRVHLLGSTRAKYPESSFADLYDSVTMPYDLQKAHIANDAAVLEAYDFPKEAPESGIATRLFKMYQKLTENK